MLLRAWIVAPFAWVRRLWANLTDLSWFIAPFASVLASTKKGLLAVAQLVSRFRIGRPGFLELGAWPEWLRRPEWLRWRDGALGVAEVVENGFEVFMLDGIQAGG